MKDRSSGASDLAGEAYVIIRERILRGEVAIGQVISRRKIAAELGMSFLPVSEAFLRLEFDGLLESRPRAGTRVRIPSREDVRGHYLVREALEVEAARLFTEMATPEDRSDLLKLGLRVDVMRSQTETNRFYYLNLHEKLHRRISECTRCPALCDAIERTRRYPPPGSASVGRSTGHRRAAIRTSWKCWWDRSRCVGGCHARARYHQHAAGAGAS